MTRCVDEEGGGNLECVIGILKFLFLVEVGENRNELYSIFMIL